MVAASQTGIPKSTGNSDFFPGLLRREMPISFGQSRVAVAHGVEPADSARARGRNCTKETWQNPRESRGLTFSAW